MTESQFSELVTQYERLVYTICYQFTKNHHTAEDLAQDTFLSAYSHIDSCPPDSIKPWLARIATNKAKDFLKSAYTRRVSAMDDESIPKDKGILFGRAEQPEDLTIEKEMLEKMQDDIRAMKEPYLQVSILYFIEEQTVEEIAKRLERPPKTVHTQLYRAKKILQEKWKGGKEDGTIS